MPHINLAEIESYEEYAERMGWNEPRFCHQGDQDLSCRGHSDDNLLADAVLEPSCLQWGLDFG